MTAHRIDQLQVELRCASEDAAQPLMDRVAALRTRGLSALIDQVCGAASPPGRLHRIGRLEIDLGTLPADGMEDALLQRLAPALRQALARALQAEPAGQADAEAALDWLRCRARTGLLPWWAVADGDAAAPRHMAVLRAARGWGALLAALADDPVALRRLATVGGLEAVALDDDAGTARLQAAADELGQRLLADRLDAAGEGAVAAVAPAPVLLRWHAALLTVLAGAHLPGVQPVLDAALRRLPADDRRRLVQGATQPAHSREAAVALDRLASAWMAGNGMPDGAPGAAGAASPVSVTSPTAGDDSPPGPVTDGGAGRQSTSAPNGPDIAGAPAASTGAATGAPDGSEAIVAPAALSWTPPGQRAGPPDQADRPERAERAARQALAAMESVDVPDAGLVLLWPFIARLFDRCGLLTPADDARPASPRGFVDAAARTRGVLLLAQLSWPEPAPAEPRLALAKLLCGCSPEAPFEPDGVPTAAESEACADLLDAALAHAAAVVPGLARVDAASFRTLFVQRAGLLGARHGSWLLQVEQRPEDLLLDRLPWSWGWVRLPWMADPLQVQW